MMREVPENNYDTFAKQLGRFCCNNALSAQDWENRLHAWESDMLYSLYTPPTNLSIVKMGGWGSIKTPSPNLTGPHLGSKVFTMDTWSRLQKYWLRRAWHTLNGLKKKEERFSQVGHTFFFFPPSLIKPVWCDLIFFFFFILVFWKAAYVYRGLLETLIGCSGCDSAMTYLSHTNTHKKTHESKDDLPNSALGWSGRCGS